MSEYYQRFTFRMRDACNTCKSRCIGEPLLALAYFFSFIFSTAVALSLNEAAHDMTLCRLCSQMLHPSLSLHPLLVRLCSHFPTHCIACSVISLPHPLAGIQFASFYRDSNWSNQHTRLKPAALRNSTSCIVETTKLFSVFEPLLLLEALRHIICCFSRT